MQHAKYSASGAYRWLSCPASVETEKPHDTNSAAQQGQLAHHQSEMILSGRTPEDVLPFVQDYVDYVLSIEGERLIEQRVNYEFGFGTSDVITFAEDGTCHIIDLKYGKMFVDVKYNSQLMLYASGVLKDFSFMDIKTFVLHIYQPRANNISKWEVSVDEIRGFWWYARSRTKLKTTFGPSESACRYCHRQGNCTALTEYMTSKFQAFGLDDSKIEFVVQNGSLINDWVKSVKESALERLEAGETIDGVKLVAGRKSTRWKNASNAPMTMQPLSPAQAKKAQIEDMPEVITVDGKLTIAHESDRRKEVKKLSFGGLTSQRTSVPS